MLTFLTPNLKLMSVLIFLMMIWTTLLSYLCLVVDHIIGGGGAIFTKIAMSNEWLEVLKDLTWSSNSTHVGRFFFNYMQ